MELATAEIRREISNWKHLNMSKKEEKAEKYFSLNLPSLIKPILFTSNGTPNTTNYLNLLDS